MIKLNSLKESTIQFDVDVKNMGDGNLTGFFRLLHENIEYGFPVNINGRRAKIKIPALSEVIKDLTNSKITAKLEFVGGSDYVEAFTDTVELHVPPNVEVKVAAKEKLDIGISTSITIEEDKSVAPVKEAVKVSKTKTEGKTKDEGVIAEKIAPSIKVDRIEVPDIVWAAVKPRPKRILSEEEQYAESKKRILERCAAKKSMGDKGGGFSSFFAEANTKVETTDPDKGDSHWHLGTVDDEGDGKTTKTMRVAVKGTKPDKHQHKIVGAEVQSANGHTHFLK